MNGIEKITARIVADAEADIQAVQAEAMAKCQEIKAAYDKTAQEEYWRLVKAGAKDCEERILRAGRTAGMDAKKAMLAMKQELVSRAFDLAINRLVSMPEARYVAFLAGQAAAAARKGTETLALNADDGGRVGAKVVKAANELLAARGLKAGLTLSKTAVPIQGGLILQDGDIQINCSIERLIEQYRGRLAAQVAEVLFET